ncbi:MAG: TonB-dependent receptor, partial [Acidobacteriaceae bacterium]|nr:TonB-dependent receptor [Acidobacteriaceae bacterium]
VVPNAKVIATEIETGVTNERTTNESGDYWFPNLGLGNYTLTFSASLFEPVRVEKVQIHIASTIRQDATLAPSTVRSQILVVDSTPLVKSDTSEIGQLVESRQISELPLDGRQVYSLLTLTAGSETSVAPTTATQYTDVSRPTIAGARAGATVFRINGIDVNNQNLPSASVQPSVDAVEEFRAITQLAPASESSTSSVNLATKSGTNDFHGTAYDFLRNNILDAHPFFQRQIVTPGYTYVPDQLRYNQFGGSIGGPIKKDRTFFFASIQSTLTRTHKQVDELYPTASMLSGDFSGINPLTLKNFGPVYDPQTGAPFPNNQIPSSRFSAFAQRFLSLAFLPANCLACLSSGLGFDFVGTAPGKTNDVQYLGRIDHHFSDKDSLFGNLLIEPNTTPSNTTPIAISQMNIVSRSYSAGLNETHVFRANWINELRLGYTRDRANLVQAGNASTPYSFSNTPFSDPSLYPTIAVVGYPSFGNGAISDRNSEVEDSWDLNDNVSYLHGTHEFKAGFENIRSRFINRLNLNAFFVYTNGLPAVLGFTGAGFADFLVGVPFEGVTFQGTGKADGVSRSMYTGYIQDNWKVHPKLTLNLGIRYELPQPWRDLDRNGNRLSTLDVSAYSQSIGGRFLLAGSPDYYVPGQGVITASGAPLVRNSIVVADKNDWQPRVGFAYRPFNNNKTAIRGGFGIYYFIQDANSLAFEMASPPFEYQSTTINLPPYVPLGRPLHDNQFFPATSAAGAGSEGDYPGNRDPRTYEWQFDIQHQIANNILLSAEYLGNHGLKLPVAFQINQAPLPNPQQLSLLLQNPSLDTTLALSRATYPNIPLSYQYVENVGTSSYHALNLKTEGKFERRLTFSAIYTWSKALDDTSSEQDIPAYTANLALNHSYSAYDHPQRFVGSWVYDLPFGQTILNSSNRWAQRLFKGWELSGIATLEGGAPYSVTTGVDTSFRGGSTTYADLTGPPVYGSIRADNGIYLTPQNFVAPPFGQLGTLARNAFHGPGTNNYDTGLIKNTTLTERLQLQLRGELFNAFNHAQFQFGGSSLATSISASAANPNTPVLTYVPASEFGRATPLPARIVQFGAKLIW